MSHCHRGTCRQQRAKQASGLREKHPFLCRECMRMEQEEEGIRSTEMTRERAFSVSLQQRKKQGLGCYERGKERGASKQASPAWLTTTPPFFVSSFLLSTTEGGRRERKSCSTRHVLEAVASSKALAALPPSLLLPVQHSNSYTHPCFLPCRSRGKKKKIDE